MSVASLPRACRRMCTRLGRLIFVPCSLTRVSSPPRWPGRGGRGMRPAARRPTPSPGPPARRTGARTFGNRGRWPWPSSVVKMKTPTAAATAGESLQRPQIEATGPVDGRAVTERPPTRSCCQWRRAATGAPGRRSPASRPSARATAAPVQLGAEGRGLLTHPHEVGRGGDPLRAPRAPGRSPPRARSVGCRGGTTPRLASTHAVPSVG